MHKNKVEKQVSPSLPFYFVMFYSFLVILLNHENIKAVLLKSANESCVLTAYKLKGEKRNDLFEKNKWLVYDRKTTY